MISEKIYKYLGNKKVTLMQKFFFLIYGRRHVTKEILGSKMILDVFDKGISFDLLSKGIREKKAMKYLQKLIKKGDTILDIGSNIGYYALTESRRAGKNGLVYAIEPEKNNFAKLKENIALNGYRNIQAYNYAVGSQTKKCKLLVHPTESNLHSICMNKNFNQSSDYQIVEMTTVNDFLRHKKFPRIIRMDVEGFECEIIKGMGNTLKKKNSLIMFIEIHNSFMGAKKSIELLDTLLDAGFRIDYIVFDTGEGILPPKYLRVGYRKFKERMKKSASPETAFRKELEQGKYNYEVFFKR